MNDLALVLAVALLPGVGNIAGGLLAESLRAPPWIIGAALHAAAGVAIAVVSVELMPRILDETLAWLMVTGFLAGAGLSVLLASGLRYWVGSRKGESGAWMVFVAVSADILSDGLMVGVGSAISGSLGLLVGLSQVVANVPGGFAAIGNFRNKQVPKKRRLMILRAFLAPPIAGALIGFLLLRGAEGGLQHAAMAVMVGVLLLATVEDMVPQADEPGVARWISPSSFAGGFAAFALLSIYPG